jgi:hypothetical protein
MLAYDQNVVKLENMWQTTGQTSMKHTHSVIYTKLFRLYFLTPIS